MRGLFFTTWTTFGEHLVIIQKAFNHLQSYKHARSSYTLDFRAHLFHDADHLVADCDAWNGARNAAVLDVQVTAADAGKGHLDDGVLGGLEGWLRLVLEFEMSFIYIYVCFHGAFPFRDD